MDIDRAIEELAKKQQQCKIKFLKPLILLLCIAVFFRRLVYPRLDPKRILLRRADVRDDPDNCGKLRMGDL